MAVEMREVRVCDVCGAGASADRIRIGWGTSFYEVDLCDEHHAQVVSLMDKVVANSRRLGADRSGPKEPQRSFTPPLKRAPAKVDTAAVRVWAKAHGIDVSERGRIPDAVIARYRAETRSS